MSSCAVMLPDGIRAELVGLGTEVLWLVVRTVLRRSATSKVGLRF